MLMRQNKNSVVLVLPFFGRLPWYFCYFLDSVSRVSMDVLLVSDIEVRNVPDNVTVMQMSLTSLLSLIAEKLGREIQCDGPYKLCDFKPMYGRIFEDYLEPYEYWAYGDCDVIYGLRMNEFLSKSIASGLDIVSMRRHWLSGPFCLIRNCKEMNSLYLQARDLEDVYKTGRTICFDELGGYWFEELKTGVMTMADCAARKGYFCATVWSQKGIKFHHDDEMSECRFECETAEMRGGRLFVGGFEYPMLHLMHAKRGFAFIGRARSQQDICDYRIANIGFVHNRFKWCFRRQVYLLRRLKYLMGRMMSPTTRGK